MQTVNSRTARRLKEIAHGETVIAQFVWGSWVEEEQFWVWDQELECHIQMTVEEIEHILMDARRAFGSFRKVRLVKEQLMWPLVIDEEERLGYQISDRLAA